MGRLGKDCSWIWDYGLKGAKAANGHLRRVRAGHGEFGEAEDGSHQRDCASSGKVSGTLRNLQGEHVASDTTCLHTHEFVLAAAERCRISHHRALRGIQARQVVRYHLPV